MLVKGSTSIAMVEPTFSASSQRLAKACGVTRNVAALLVELSADLDVPCLKLGCGFKKVLADPIGRGPLLAGLEPVDKKLDFKMDDAVVAANSAHLSVADFVPHRDEILMDDTEAGIAGPGRPLRPDREKAGS